MLMSLRILLRGLYLNKNLADVNTERAFLACVIKDIKLLDEYSRVHRGWFDNSLSKKVFDSIFLLHQDSKIVDDVIVRAVVNDDFLIDEIFNTEHMIGNVSAYVDVLEDRFLRRELVRRSNGVVNVASNVDNEDISAKSLLDKALSELNDLSIHHLSSANLRKLGDIGVDVMKNVKKTRELGISPFNITTDIKSFNKVVPGFIGGDYVILAARPGQGKTALAMQIARANAIQGNSFGMLSMEMSKKMLFIRYLSFETGINAMRIIEGKLTDFEWKQLSGVWQRLNKLPIYIDDTSFVNEMDIKTIARSMVDNYGIKGFIIDYLQLADCSVRKESRQQEITHISRHILSLSKELDLPIIALSQLSRAVEERTDKKPRLSDLRESGSLEQDSTHVVLLYNPSYYDIKEFSDGSPTDGIIEATVAKYRNGATGYARMAFLKEQFKFGDIDMYHWGETQQEIEAF